MRFEIEFSTRAVYGAHPNARLVDAEQLADEFSEIDALFGIKVKCQLIAIPKEDN